jgi:hypothetical protein
LSLGSLLVTLLLFALTAPPILREDSESAISWLELGMGVDTELFTSSSPATAAAAAAAVAAPGAATGPAGAQRSHNRADASGGADSLSVLHRPVVGSSAGVVWVLRDLLLLIGLAVFAISMMVHFWLRCRQSGESFKSH